MAKKKKSTESFIESTSSISIIEPAPNNRAFEAIGIAMVLVAIALCFALFSFDPGSRDNLVGPVGNVIARVLLGGVGVVGYVVGLACVAFAGATLFGRVRLPSPVALLSAVSITLGATVLAHLVAGEPAVLGHPAGGVVGVVIGEMLASVVGAVGAALVAVGATLLGVIGISDLSLSAAIRDGFGSVRLVWLRMFGQVSVWTAARTAAKTREEEVVEAARSRRAQAELDQRERERKLLEDLEEKKRIAILKATAKAEEKALARIAAEEAKERIEAEVADAVEEEDLDEDAVYEDEDPTPDPELVEVGLPGPAAEPEIQIDSGLPSEPELIIANLRDQTPVEDAAEVIDQIDRETQLPARVDDEAEVEDEYAEEEDAYEEEEDDEEYEYEEDESYVDDEEDTVPSQGPMIHERVKTEASFEDEAQQQSLPIEPEKITYQLPPISLLDYEGDAPEEVDQTMLRARATRLEEKLETYGVKGKVMAIRPGPVVTTYEYQPAPGVKVSKIANLADDIAMSMEAVRVRIVAPIPGRGVVGIELPNDKRENVYLKEIVGNERFKKSKSLLTLALGKDAEGDAQVRDLRKMPHFLIAGTTGSGKSVSINTMILSILYKATPDQVKFIMVDPKMLELSLYQDIPHLLLPVVTDPRKASRALQWAVDEMERRYQLLSEMKVRDLDSFNKKLAKLADARSAAGDDELSEVPTKGKLHDPWPGQDLPEELPYIVVLIDEFADLMCVAPRDVEASVQRLAQKARAAGIHVLLATQRPSTDVITGVIKNNFPSRISFRVASRHDSATILNNPGAENLLGRGDSLMLGVNSPSPVRIHGGFVSEDEVERVVEFWKAQARPKYDPTILQKRDEDESAGAAMEDADEHYDTAVRIVTDTQKASISALQRKLRVGYNRAARMIEMMEMQGIVGPASGPKGEREVLVRPIGPDGPDGS